MRMNRKVNAMLIVAAVVAVGAWSTMATAGKPLILYTPWISPGSGANNTICLALNVGTKPHDVTLDIIDSTNGTVLFTQTCTALAPSSQCFTFGAKDGYQDEYCRVTFAGKKTDIRADLVVRDDANNTPLVVLPAT